MLLAWLHQSLINEVLVLEHTALDSFKYGEVINSIFDRALTRSLITMVETEINTKAGDFVQSFELFYLLMVFKMGVPSALENQKLWILDSLPDLR